MGIPPFPQEKAERMGHGVVQPLRFFRLWLRIRVSRRVGDNPLGNRGSGEPLRRGKREILFFVRHICCAFTARCR